MPIAAVPQYLGADFSAASPGLRFGMYLKLWGINQRSKELLWTTHDIDYAVRGQDRQEREIRPENKVAALKDATPLNAGDKAVMQAQLARQRGIFSALPEACRLALDAQAVAPFTTGLGNEHPLENGFAFLNPYGLPYLPGSGIKGVLRQAARELASGEWGDTQGWTDDTMTALFGRQSNDGDTKHLRGALTFWDVIPQIKGDHLSVEIMTPNQTHYYQKGESPHDSGSPTPISFLTVPPDSGFTFHVQCDLALLARTTPELAKNGQWKTLLQVAFAHAFEWLGFGAKTAVGYGAMKEDLAQKSVRQKEMEEQQEAARRNAMSEEDRLAEDHQKTISEFQGKFDLVEKTKYQPGSKFDNDRHEFMKIALSWDNAHSRQQAGNLLTKTLKWGVPSNKESKQRLKDAVAALKGNTAG